MLYTFLLLSLLTLDGIHAKRVKQKDEVSSSLSTASGATSTESNMPLANFGEDMWFGLATAAAHVETAYPNDPWVDWAKKGHVAAYKSNVSGPDPDMRLRFLEEPEVELDLAAKTGVKVFRMGVEWGRLVPAHPEGKEGVQNRTALEQYRNVIQMAKDRNMEVMLTLFHHSMPLWSSVPGGWLQDDTVDHFLALAKDVATEFKDIVDYWVTFNEPHIYVLLSNCAGLWPPGPVASLPTQLACAMGHMVNKENRGYTKAIGNIQKAHIEFYKWAHSTDSPLPLKSRRIGVAHNVAVNEAHSVTDIPAVAVTDKLFKFGFIDALKGHLDWLGLNYYSKEIIGGAGPMILDEEEYSESGRTVHPDGLFDVLMEFNERFPQSDPEVSFKSIIVTENGISDASDILRPSYIIEHLLAVREAKRQGVPIEGYVHWTISDNWEWADGYCPKFGLVDVDRSTDKLTRTTRKSYDLFKDIVTTGQITQDQRDNTWELVRQAVISDTSRPFCRAADGKTGLDDPVPRKVVKKDWRFTKYGSPDSHGGSFGSVHALAAAEAVCHFTPWSASEHDDPPQGRDKKTRHIVAHTSSGTCDVLDGPFAQIKSHCRQSVTMERWKRCAGVAPIKEEKGFVCERSPLVTQRKSSFGLKAEACTKNLVRKQSCCCDDDRCGYTAGAPESKCPVGLQDADWKKCEN